MICRKCDAQIPDDATVCPICGKTAVDGDIPVMAESPAPANVTKTSVVKSKRNAVLLAIGVVVVIGLLTAGILFARSGLFSGTATDESAYPTSSNLLLIQEENDESPYPTSSNLLMIQEEKKAYIYGTGSEPIIVDGAICETKYTMDGKELAVGLDRNADGYILSYCDGSNLFKVANNVDNFIFSASGNKIIYLTDYEDQDRTGDLYVYDVTSKKSTKIIDDAYREFAISPDGGSIAYATDVSVELYGGETGLTGYVQIEGKEAEALGENKIAFALSNSGKYIYYLERTYSDVDGNNLYVRNEESDNEIVRNGNNISNFCLNRDCSEILFRSDHIGYICINGAEKVKIADEFYSFRMIMPDEIQRSYSITSEIINVSTFSDQLYYSSYNIDDAKLVYLKNDLSTEQVLTCELDNFTMSSDGKAIYHNAYINDSWCIEYYNNYRDYTSDADIIWSDKAIWSYLVMPDQSAVYFVDEIGDLWVASGSSEPKKMDTDVDNHSLTVSSDGKGIYYFTGDYYSINGQRPEQTLKYVANEKGAVPYMIAEKVNFFEVTDYGTVYYVYQRTDAATQQEFGTAYLSRSGNNFTKVTDEAYACGHYARIVY